MESFDQNKIKRDYQEMATIHDEAVKYIPELDRDIETAEGFSEAIIYKGIRLLAKYNKWVSEMSLKWFNKKIDKHADELRTEFDKLSQEVEDAEGVILAHLSSGGSPEDAENLKVDLQNAEKKLQDFINEKMIYNFSEEELKQRDDKILKEAVKEMTSFINFLNPESRYVGFTDDEKEYLQLKSEARGQRSYAELLDGSTKLSAPKNPLIAAEVRKAYNNAVDAEVRLREFIIDHKGIDDSVEGKRIKR
ncbi:MAG: hypothetical protein WC631_00845 [Candidatus Paceibacterota bacterium]|jgi:hypothetical protein